MHSRASCPGKREVFAVWNSGKLGIKFISSLAIKWVHLAWQKLVKQVLLTDCNVAAKEGHRRIPGKRDGFAFGFLTASRAK